MDRRLTIVCAAKLHKNQLERHLELLERLDVVERIIVVRHEPLPERLSKLENVTFGNQTLPLAMWQMFRRVGEVLDRERVDWVVGFNPVPWGALAETMARRHGVRSCLSLIGRDYQQVQGPFGWPFLRSLKKADAVTVTGGKMQDGLVRLGVERHKIHILPHSVDLGRFCPNEGVNLGATSSSTGYDIVSVGQLIRRKRMDVLLRALAELRDAGLKLRLGVLGKGPEEAALRELVQTLSLADQVEFLPYRDDVETVLRSARIFALVSAWEGVPFALMEAMACGLVPVVTDVGTIGDWVRHNDNGKLVSVDDAGAVSRAIAELLARDAHELKASRANLLAERERLGFQAGMHVWREIFAPCALNR